jgi:hypothetical protein
MGCIVPAQAGDFFAASGLQLADLADPLERAA